MVADIPLQNLVVFWVGAFLRAFAAGGAGFAFALAASAVWLHVLDPLHTTAMVVASGTLLHGILIWPIRRSIEMARLWPLIAGAAFGIPLGVALLSHTRPDITRTAIGGFLVAYGLYALTAPQLPYFGRGGRAADALVGFAGGILGGLGGYSGVLPTIWTQIRGWPKEVARGVYQPFIVFAQVGTLLLMRDHGRPRRHSALRVDPSGVGARRVARSAGLRSPERPALPAGALGSALIVRSDAFRLEFRPNGPST